MSVSGGWGVVVAQLPRQTSVDAVLSRLLADVLDGTYSPGGYLPPALELASSYDVTPTSLGHALVQLERAGLFETRYGAGTRVWNFERHGGPEPESVDEDAAAQDGPTTARRVAGAASRRQVGCPACLDGWKSISFRCPAAATTTRPAALLVGAGSWLGQVGLGFEPGRGLVSFLAGFQFRAAGGARSAAHPA